MAVLTYKCPNCGSGLEFDPATQELSCHSCGSRFTKDELDKMSPASQSEQKDAALAGEGAEAVLYTCPSCGAEIVTDVTTAATFCFYCHNPVVLSGRLSGDWQPDKVLPFTIKREEAISGFMKWVKKKKFVPKAFFSEKQIEHLTGVYYPYWMVDSDRYAQASGQATRLRVWTSGDTRITETSFYKVERGGNVHFKDLTKSALQKADRDLAELVQPFDTGKMEDFSMAYLSGFQAEKRDLDRDYFQKEVDEELDGYTQELLRYSVDGYNTVSLSHPQYEGENRQKWQYVLLPVWTLTYQGRGNKTYYYLMNGQTGEVQGVLPVSLKRLAGLFLGISLSLFALLCIGGYLL